jgi:hypothetical protein
MTYLKTLGRAAGIAVCVVAFCGTALADPGNGNGGPEATPPGQEKKAETPAAPAPTPAPAAQAANGQEKKAENQAEHAAKKAESKPAAASTAAKAAAPGQAKKAENQATKAEHSKADHAKKAEHSKPDHATKADKPDKAAQASTSKGQSANAHHHVIICHRTGSDSNPYVVINIPLTAWQHAHAPGGHPTLNGRDDILLKDPASRPGSKDGFSKSACGASVAAVAGTTTTTTTTTTTAATLTATTTVAGSVTAPVLQPAATVTTAGSVLAATGSSPKASGVLGAVSPAKAAPAKQPAGGVLGATARAGKQLGQTATGSLPFTGIPLWIAALIGGALLAAGLTLRRSA